MIFRIGDIVRVHVFGLDGELAKIIGPQYIDELTTHLSVEFVSGRSGSIHKNNLEWITNEH